MGVSRDLGSQHGQSGTTAALPDDGDDIERSSQRLTFVIARKSPGQAARPDLVQPVGESNVGDGCRVRSELSPNLRSLERTTLSDRAAVDERSSKPGQNVDQAEPNHRRPQGTVKPGKRNAN